MTKIEIPQQQTEQERYLEESKKEVSKIFLKFKGQQRSQEIINLIKHYLKLEELDKDKIIAEIKKCESIDEEEMYVDQITKAFEPIYDFKIKNPELHEKISRKAFVEKYNFIPLNEVFSYGVGENGWIHIHHAPAKTIPLEERGKLAGEMMIKLAEIAKDDPRIKGISATSWIVAKRPEWLTSMGFEILGPIDDKLRQQYFEGEEGEIHRAEISREELLKRYLK